MSKYYWSTKKKLDQKVSEKRGVLDAKGGFPTLFN